MINIRKPIILLGFLAALSLCFYLVTSQIIFHIGFPLDDAWIHQTYARNLALVGEWAFIPGEISGGSTSPLWSFLLSIGHFWGLGPYIWTFVLGWLALWGTSCLGMLLFKYFCPSQKNKAIWVGIFLTLEWHLVWFSGSGMETSLYAFFVLLIFLLLFHIDEQIELSFCVGIIMGLIVWLRPDGMTLLGPTLLIVAAKPIKVREKVKITGILIACFLILFLLYLLFNQRTAGTWWPNTFFAKQAEYVMFRQTPFLVRYWEQLIQSFKGPGIALFPFVLMLLFHTIKHRKWDFAAIYLWLLGYPALYALRLPVVYQHGRYVFPMMPLLFIIGFVALSKWLWVNSTRRSTRLFKFGWNILLSLLTIGAWVMGMITYGNDVYYIESEMVETAHWLKKNTPEDVLIAVHDIGAIGYFSDRRLLDLAGLISPEIIPLIRDENKIKKYLDNQNVMYLVTFPDWYPELIKNGILVYQTNSPIRPSFGKSNMAVFQWSD